MGQIVHRNPPRIAIVDFGMGNLFSVQNACAQVGLDATITSQAELIRAADGVILPGVGAFGDAIKALETMKLADTVVEAACIKPFMGICLGMQLLMTTSHEFGTHKGLNVLAGEVVPLQGTIQGAETKLKVPHVGWNRIYPPSTAAGWPEGLLRGHTPGDFMYFVHSFHVVADEASLCQSVTCYGPWQFCSSLSRGKLFACQFHPERSGPKGLEIYRQFGQMILSDH